MVWNWKINIITILSPTVCDHQRSASPLNLPLNCNISHSIRFISKWRTMNKLSCVTIFLTRWSQIKPLALKLTVWSFRDVGLKIFDEQLSLSTMIVQCESGLLYPSCFVDLLAYNNLLWNPVSKLIITAIIQNCLSNERNKNIRLSSHLTFHLVLLRGILIALIGLAPR